MHHLYVLRPLLGLFVAGLLAACGGGDGGRSYTVGGTVSGLAGSGLVLRDNGGDSLSVSEDGSFTFHTPVADGQIYTVTLGSQPASPFQTCTIANGTGRLSGSPVTTVTVDCVTALVALFAGNLGGPGSADGPSAIARFYWPFGVAADSAGNIYVTDTYNYTIRKIAPDGVVSTLAGLAGDPGSTDGTGSAARFTDPIGAATDSAGNLYVSDDTTIRKITTAGVVSTFAHTAGGGLEGIAADSAGNIYVADAGNCTILKITPAGAVSTLAGTAGACGSVDATGAAARFRGPSGVAVDNAGNVYVADTVNYTVRKITSGGLVSTLAGMAGVQGTADGTGAAARFFLPAGVITDSSGNLYVSDNTTIRKITSDSVVTTIAGASAGFNGAQGIAIDSKDNLYVADTYNDGIRKITPADVVSTLTGAPDVPGYADGIGPVARFDSPSGIATDLAGNVYVADTYNESIRAITPEGAVSTLAGAPYLVGDMNPACQSADGIGTAARFCNPQGLAIDNKGNVYVADFFNSTVRKITPAGAVTTLAGLAGSSGSVDGIGAAARFLYPQGIATDSAGNIYVADTNNSTIRKITPAGVVSTFAGTAGDIGSADATGAAARFNYPVGVVTDGADNVYVADTNSYTIRKITPSGMVSTLAGAAGVAGSADGVATSARFNYPRSIAIDSTNNLYVADTSNSSIRKITPAGVVTTLVGISGQAGFAPGALPGLLAQPVGVAISGKSLYITLYNGVAVVQNLP
jgi:sugar lactone lactonase YvrE